MFNKNLFPDCVKSIGYSVSAGNIVPPNPCVGPSSRIKISFPLLLICTDELHISSKNYSIFTYATVR